MGDDAEDTVLLRSMFIKTDDGYLEIRYFGRRIVWIGPAPFFILNVSDWQWDFQPSPSLALVKEAPKALTLYRERFYGPATATPVPIS